MNRNPQILEQLAQMFPRDNRRGDTSLAEDLAMTAPDIQRLSLGIERAWNIDLSPRAVESWQTIDDIAASIADSLELVTA
jgi:acyl carrier protein